MYIIENVIQDIHWTFNVFKVNFKKKLSSSYSYMIHQTLCYVYHVYITQVLVVVLQINKIELCVAHIYSKQEQSVTWCNDSIC